MASSMRIVFGLLTFVTVGMIIGALLQLAFIRRFEDSYGTEFPSFRRLHERQNIGNLQLSGGISYWANDKEAETLRLGYVKPEIISWSPRIIVLHNFLSTEECDYLRAIAKPRLQISTVVDTKTGKGIKSDVRTSSGMFLSPEERKYPMVQAIEKRISVYSQVPVENGELIQVLRYEKNQFYRPHHDYFSDTFNLKRGGQRVATVLMYLSDNVEGGETYFPAAQASSGQAGSGECSCGGKMMKGLCVKPVKGDAVLFWSMVCFLVYTSQFLFIKYIISEMAFWSLNKRKTFIFCVFLSNTRKNIYHNQIFPECSENSSWEANLRNFPACFGRFLCLVYPSDWYSFV